MSRPRSWTDDDLRRALATHPRSVTRVAVSLGLEPTGPTIGRLRQRAHELDLPVPAPVTPGRPRPKKLREDCAFPECVRPVEAYGMCHGHRYQYESKGFLMPLGPAWRHGERWTLPFAVRFATVLLAYHAPERLAPRYRDLDRGQARSA